MDNNMSNKENIAILLGVLYCRLLLYSIHSSLDFMASILYIVIDKRSCLLVGCYDHNVCFIL